VDRPKWHSLTCPAEEHEAPGCTLAGQPSKTAQVHREPLPDNAYWRRMKAGHRARTGHDLDAILVTGPDGISHVQRYCCDEDQPSLTPEDRGWLGEHGIQARRRRSQGSLVTVAVNHEDMSEAELRAHMRDRHGFWDSPEDPDWLIEQTHKDEHADEPLEHRHPDLERWPEEELAGEQLPLSDRDFLHQHGIEAARRDPD